MIVAKSLFRIDYSLLEIFLIYMLFLLFLFISNSVNSDSLLGFLSSTFFFFYKVLYRCIYLIIVLCSFRAPWYEYMIFISYFLLILFFFFFKL